MIHCRTGSLETYDEVTARSRYNSSLPHRQLRNLRNWMKETALRVHCRTGSSEMKIPLEFDLLEVHCRTGSLEIGKELPAEFNLSSLPHRQLRNEQDYKVGLAPRSLPHRQLRNLTQEIIRKERFTAAQAA